MAQEIVVGAWNTQDNPGVMRLNGFHGHLISSFEISTADLEVVEKTYRSFIFDIDGTRYTVFHRESQPNKRVVMGSGFSNHRTPITYVLSGNHLDAHNVGLASHPQLSGFLFDIVNDLFVVEESKDDDPPATRISIEKLNQVNESNLRVKYFFDAFSNLNHNVGTRVYSYFKIQADEDEPPWKTKFNLSTLAKFLTINCFRGQVYEPSEIFFSLAQETPVEDGFRSKRAKIIGGAIDPHYGKGSSEFHYSLFKPNQFIRLCQVILCRKNTYSLAINSIHESLKPGKPPEEVFDNLIKAIEYCNVSEAPNRLTREDFEKMKSVLVDAGFKDQLDALSNFSTLKNKLTFLLDKLFRETEFKDIRSDSTIRNIVRFRNDFTHGRRVEERARKDVYDNFSVYRALIILSLLHYISNKHFTDIAIKIDSFNSLSLQLK